MDEWFHCECGCGHRFRITEFGPAAMLIVASGARTVGMHTIGGAAARRVAYAILGSPERPLRSVSASFPPDQMAHLVAGHAEITPEGGMRVNESMPNGSVVRGFKIWAR